MAIRTGDWSERRDIADQVDEANAAWRDEIASQRAEDAHQIAEAWERAE